VRPDGVGPRACKAAHTSARCSIIDRPAAAAAAAAAHTCMPGLVPDWTMAAAAHTCMPGLARVARVPPR
jgi:hypothetical protein